MNLNETHDPDLASWIESANEPRSDFPIQNLPFGVFRRAGGTEEFRGGIAIGDQILDLAAVLAAGEFREAAVGRTAAQAARAAAEPALNALMAAGPAFGSALRLALSRALRQGAARRAVLEACLVPQSHAEWTLPARIGDYTDFYTSIHHATAVGRLLRPDQPLLPNYKWVPIAYHGRSSSIVVSGQSIVRPVGQILASGASVPSLAPTRRLDYELELGVFIGAGNALGSGIALAEAESHVFGLCLLNDWSARDVQTWEYQPLGPFLSKSFATTISPWIVTLEALEPFRVPWERPVGDPQPLAYLDSAEARSRGAIDVQLEVLLETEAMRRAGAPPCRLSHTLYKHAYWTVGQMIAHHTMNGCNLRPGDLLATGTQSGPAPGEGGSLLELSSGGRQPVQLPNGETRGFLDDGDTVTLRACCARPGAARIGFGCAAGRVLAARLPTPKSAHASTRESARASTGESARP
ncbi:MAG TPA: fumarylacetoacetase [Steroidobacteraceae bacterium]|nr:fumarylacetoacetase [Steroidobacteraceae bacterium]